MDSYPDPCQHGSCRFGIFIHASIFSLSAVVVLSQTGPAQAVPNGASAETPIIVVGFVGGFIKHDNLIHSEVQLAARLRTAYPTGVDVETFESYHGEKARERILGLLDANHEMLAHITV